METITKQKIYFWLIAVIAILNLAALFLLWKGEHPKLPPPREPDRDLAFAALNLSPDQKKTFDIYNERYFISRDSLVRLLNSKKKELFEEVFKRNSDKLSAEKLADEIGFLNSEMEKTFYKHFTNLKSILTEEQLRIFQNIIMETAAPHFEDARRPPHFHDLGEKTFPF